MHKETDARIAWLLEGDISIRYQVTRDFLDRDETLLRERILREGWGKAYMDRQNSGGGWGDAYYSPKWISSHYTLLDLKNLCAPPDDRRIRRCIDEAIAREKGVDGGINPSKTRPWSDICVNGMFLNFACYFGAEEEGLHSIIDHLLGNLGEDGGFNCECAHNGYARGHSSMHTTLSVLEGFLEYRANGYSYRIDEVREAEGRAREFLLMHRLFRSDRTGEIIDAKFLRFTYPYRWKYTVLRAMDYFRATEHPYDTRMREALDVIYNKCGMSGIWKLQSKFSGREHFAMEPVGEPSRWVTMTALRVLRHYGPEYGSQR
jgi:hypothetical protein